jgi:hypothetical protein
MNTVLKSCVDKTRASFRGPADVFHPKECLFRSEGRLYVVCIKSYDGVYYLDTLRYYHDVALFLTDKRTGISRSCDS